MNIFRKLEQVIDGKTGQTARVVRHKDDGFVVIKFKDDSTASRYYRKLEKIKPDGPK